ncbi:MAG: pilus assembly protein N-terminal domain-containing protein, partial [Deltaproteobacteria bacterium]
AYNHRIQRFSPGGHFLRALAASQRRAPEKIPLLLVSSILFFIIFSLSLSVFPQEKPVTISKTLIKDVSETVDLDFLPGNIFVANPKVCNYVALREQKKIMLIPVGEGTTSLTIQDTQGRERQRIKIRVIVSDLYRISKELKDLLGDIEGVEIKVIGKKVLIDGEILLPKDLNRIITVANQYGLKQEVGIIAALSPIAQKIIAQKIEEDIHKLGFTEVRVRAVNQRFLIEGSVPHGGADGKRNSRIAVETAKTYVPDVFVTGGEGAGLIRKPGGGPPVVVNLLIIKPPPAAEPARMIHITAHYVELSKEYAKNFAFNWSPGIQDSTAIQFEKGELTGTLTGTVSSLIPKLNAAKTHGHARILEASSLIVQDNEKGNIKNITQIPITVFQTTQGGTQQGTEFKDVGLTMDITPTVIPETTSVRLKINFSVKTVLGFNERGQPSISESNIETILTVDSAQSAAIGGLVRNQLITAYNKLPPSIRDNPNILFSLFRSKSFQNNKSQFVIFITPDIIKSASEGAEELKRKFRVK